MRGPITPEMLTGLMADEESLALLAAEPGWKILENRMEVMLGESYAVMDESATPEDTFRLHKANAIRKVLVTLLEMVREAPKRHAALVSGGAALSADPAPDSLV